MSITTARVCLGWSCLVIALFVALGSYVDKSSADPAIGAEKSAAFALERIELPAPMWCSLRCWSVGCGGIPEHQTTGGDTHGGDDHDCAGSEEGKSCSSPIHECTVPVPLPAPNDATVNLFLEPEFWIALENAPGRTLKAFIENNAHAAWFNEERQSIQVSGCSDRVMANIVLSPEQISALALDP